MRIMTYSKAINEALYQAMKAYPSVFLLGQGIRSPWYVGNTCEGLLEKFGEARVIDTPISENAINGSAVGAAICGMRPVVVHPRIDFMVYGLDPIINEAANWHYMFGGMSSAPMVVWAIINRGGEQGAQHSQALQALFAHIPGLKVVMPSNPYDAKGLMISAIEDNNPVVFIDDRWLYNLEDDVPSKMYSVPIGKGLIKKKGKDLTIVATSYMVNKSIVVADELKKQGWFIEVIDPRTIYPLDEQLILKSVKKTGRLVVVDSAWKFCGVGGEIIATVTEKAFNYLKAKPLRVTLPNCPAPSSRSLENAYYLSEKEIFNAVKSILVK
ncbi:MAG: transketolase C-terminal domain-containing protein [bacterium]